MTIHIKNHGRQQGFTLLEALIAFVVLAGGLLATFRFHSTTMEGVAEAKISSQATALADQKIEEFRSFQDGDSLALTLAANGADVANAFDADGYAASFTRSWTVAGTNPKEVTVTVGWTDRRNQAQSIQLSSMIWQTEPLTSGSQLASAVLYDGNPGGGWTGGGGGDDVEVTEEDASGAPILDANGDPILDANGDPVVAATYDLLFWGSFTTLNATLDSVALSKDTGSTDTGRSCSVDAVALTYSCTITGIPINDSWLGAITFNSSATGQGTSYEGVCELIGSNATTGIDQASLDFVKSSTSLAASSTPDISSIRVVKKAGVGGGGGC